MEKVRAMNVVVYGATGKSGSKIVQELLSRGHKVTGVARGASNLPAGVTAKQDDLSDVAKIVETIKGADVVVSAYAPPMEDTEAVLGVTERQIAAVKQAGGPRLIVVGGAASLEIAPDITLLASGHMPAEWIPIGTSHGKALEMLRKSDINWTYFSPAAFFVPGERTGKFRLGKDQLIANEAGDSRISLDDYAIAMVDEIEKPAHERERFTIGY
jgi:putative NADH-flavin reductase